MSILDRYISKRFLYTLIFALFAFSCIFIIVDLVEFLDTFIDKQVPKPVIVKYYFYYLPYIVMLSLPVAMLLASLFSLGQMARYNEIIAMIASGLSLYRILFPVLMLAFVISVFSIFFGEKVVPLANQKRYFLKRVHVDKLSYDRLLTKRSNVYVRDVKGQWVIIGFYDSRLKTAYRVSIQNYQGNSLTSRIDAPRMVWNDKSWMLLNGYRRIFVGNREIATPFERLEKKDSRLLPKDLEKVQKKTEEMNYFELREFIQEVKRNGGEPNRWLVDLYLKIAFPFANFIIVLFGAPLSSKKRRSGVTVSFGVSLFICFIYFGIVKTGQTLGHNGTLPPLLAAWIGNIIFGIAGVITFIKTRK